MGGGTFTTLFNCDSNMHSNRVVYRYGISMLKDDAFKGPIFVVNLSLPAGISSHAFIIRSVQIRRTGWIIGYPLFSK